MPTNFELKRLKPKLDIVEKPENRVHKLTDSNGARVVGQPAAGRRAYGQPISILMILSAIRIPAIVDQSGVALS